MGADGHIAIYDWSKTVRNFPELEVNEDLKDLVVGDAYIYDNPVGKGKWLIAYRGDNLYEPTFPGTNLYWLREKYKDKTDLLAKAVAIVVWMENYAVIVRDWEVWT